MVVEVIIQKRAAKNKFNLLDLIQDDMRYGTFDDSFLLKENDINGPIVVFDSHNICRGHEISITDDSIVLSLTLPTNENDIHFFYRHIESICKMMETNEFIRDNEKVIIDSINNFIEYDKAASINALKDMKTKIFNHTYDDMYIFGAVNPVVFGEKQIDFVDSDLQKFGNFMNQLQSIDAYYAKPSFYRRSDSSLFGIYTISNDVTSIFPKTPKPIFVKQCISNFFVSFVVDHQIKGMISFDDFLQNVDQSNEYDAEHFIITLNENYINSLIERFKTDA